MIFHINAKSGDSSKRFVAAPHILAALFLVLCACAATGHKPISAAKPMASGDFPFGKELVDVCYDMIDHIVLTRDTLFVYDRPVGNIGQNVVKMPFSSILGDTLNYSGWGFLRSKKSRGQNRYFFIFDPERGGPLAENIFLEVRPREDVRPGIKYVRRRERLSQLVCDP